MKIVALAVALVAMALWMYTFALSVGVILHGLMTLNILTAILGAAMLLGTMAVGSVVLTAVKEARWKER
jgi:hypothetical protein